MQFTLLLRGTVNFRVFIPITIGSIQSQFGRKSSIKSTGSSPSPTITFMGLPSTSSDFTDGNMPYPNEGMEISLQGGLHIQGVRFLRTLPTISTTHTFCVSRDNLVSNWWYLLIQGYFCAL